MATQAVRIRSNVRFDNLFFSFLNVLILLAVLIGFARTYFLAGIFRAPLPNLLVHIHGAVFSSWIILLIVQTSLVSVDRTDIHRKLGMLGFALACLLVVMGVLVATESMVRSYQDRAQWRANYAINLSDMVMFSVLIYFAFRHRFRPAAHKRLILIATLSILDAALDRWPVPVAWWDDRFTPLICIYPILLLLMAYDWWSMKKVQSATIWATFLLVVVQQGRDAFGHIAPWQSFAFWTYTHIRHFF
jgi:hypothetical protein